MSSVVTRQKYLLTVAVIALSFLMAFSPGIVPSQLSHASTPVASSHSSNPSSNVATGSSSHGNLFNPSQSPLNPTNPPSPSPPSIPTQDQAPWAQRILGVHSPATRNLLPLTSYPNMNIVKDPHQVVGTINPFYGAQPAPMGISDLGLGSNGPYAYNTSHVLGQITFNAPPNATGPASYTVINPGGANLGEVGSVYEFGIQLNTVVSNVTLPGVADGVFWTQNVINFNDTGIHFVDDIFNASAGGGFYITPGTTFLPGGCPTANISLMLSVYGGVYQCVGGTIPISPADYPLTIQLYNNATVAPNGNDQIVFGYNFVGANGFHFTGVESNPVFTAPANFANPVGFQVNGKESSPAGIFYDSELTFCGQIGGDNALFTSLNGSMSLEYSNVSAGGWKNVPSAYDFGTDTGETSAGIAGYWTASHVEEINAGPSFLYGLWGSEPQVQVPVGDIQFKGGISPDYGFVFVSNIAPGPIAYNMSWVPTTNTGAFNTYLPPIIKPGTQYYVQAFAPEESEYNGTPFSTSQSNYFITMTSSPGHINAPLYMNGDAQAASLAKNVSGSSVAPYVFSNLGVNLNYTFNHLNDYHYPEFGIFQAQGLSHTVHVNNVWQGGDSGTSANYIYDVNTTCYPACGLVGDQPPSLLVGYNNLTENINIFDSASPVVTNESLMGTCTLLVGSPAIFLWKDTNTLAENVTSYCSYGVWNGDSITTTAKNVVATSGGIGVSDIGSHGTIIRGVSVPSGLGVYAYASSNGEYTWINATGTYTQAVQAGSFAGLGPMAYYNIPGVDSTSISQLGMSGFYTYGAFLEVSNHDSVSNYNATGLLYYGVVLVNDLGISITSTSFWQGGAYGIFNEYSNYTNVSNLNGYANLNGLDYGYSGSYCNYVSISGVKLNDTYYGIYSVDDNQVSISSLDTNSTYYSVYLSSSTNVTVTGATFDFWYDYLVGLSESYGIYASGANHLTLSQLTDRFENSTTVYGMYLRSTSNVTLNTLTALEANPMPVTTPAVIYANQGSNYAISGATMTGTAAWFLNGIFLDYIDGITASSLSAFFANYAIEIYYGSGTVSVSQVSIATGEGVFIYRTNSATVTTTTASNNALGVAIDYSQGDVVTTTVATNQSEGVYLYRTQDVTVNTITVSGWSLGIEVDYSTSDMVETVTATNSTLSAPWSGINFFGWPVSAVVTERSSKITILAVSATDYPMGLYDYYSSNLLVNGLNASKGDYGMVLNGTSDGIFAGIGTFQDVEGVQVNDGAFQNAIFTSAFVADSSYGVDIESGRANFVYNNNFIGDNGATSVYNELHIQAFTVQGNYFNSSAKIGNYWADWHSYNAQGHLNPYYVSDGVWDYYPLGARMGDTAVYFNEVGLPSGTSWSVTLNGTTYSTTNTWLVLDASPGTSTFSIPAVAGYSSTPTTGSVTGGTVLSTNETIFFSLIPPKPQYYAITLSETGLPTNTTWSATFNGVAQSGSATSLAYSVTKGVYNYQVGTVSGYSASPTSGSVNVTGNYTLWITFTNLNPPKPTYTVTIQESGLASGANWTASFNGVPQTANAGAALTYTTFSGTYSFAVNGVAGYTVNPASGSVSISGNYTISVTFTPVKYTVTVEEGGLSGGVVWSATVNGVTQSTAGPSLTFSETNGTYGYSVATISGYTLSCGSGTSGSVTVSGSDVTVGCQFTQVVKPGPAVASQSDLQTYFIIAVVVGIAALALAFLALLWRRKQSPGVPPPAQGTGSSTTSGPTPASEPTFGGPSGAPPPR